MEIKYRKIKKYLELLASHRFGPYEKVENVYMLNCGYKQGHTPPDIDDMQPCSNGCLWGSGKDSHAWFRFSITPKQENTYLRVFTERNGWDADNPQFMVYINGKLTQGLDTNHREVLLPNEPCDIALYGYTGPAIAKAQLFTEIRVLDTEIDGLYYDIRYPFEMLDYLGKESTEYARIIDYLWQAVSMLDMLQIENEEFQLSVAKAREFLATEFYGKYCTEQNSSTVCIGHTHIDCAWKWTLEQTREKVQRSFATVLELMKKYPEYKFMSSQALLYRFLKEEAPDLYEEVKERIKQGRWECEGSMWVEADCNLSSGESLVRQILYGKNFFKNEFGADNKILWLPDVFGYSAALPQILRKSGIEWFVTDKISWNDTNRMPYDTFRWKGIDGSEINTYFITGQNDLGGNTTRYCTYVGNTGAKMINGSYKRYSQKNLSDEVMIPFGFGDGGGGPTREHLEFIERGKKGVPGAPNTRVDFAGDFLRRLERKLENRRDVPKWQGELYLEYHRGTLTTMARNKKSNRESEFLYANAELLGVTANELLGEPFPQNELRNGWEMILTNQFHDIIPGSSIKEVYDQSDLDYAEIKRIGKDITEGIQSRISDGIDENEGYVIFNPHSFKTVGMVNIDGKTAFTKDKIASKGYAATNSFITDNHIVINNNTVETDRLNVVFDEHWQMVSVYDKKVGREVLKCGAVGNELRIHADYPDIYDAWEWQPYSLEEYKVIREYESAEIIEDGVRKGIKITRPHGNSRITQTLWFYDELPRIDFENEIDWHEHHQMLKTVFPADINTDKATYEIQFGTIERPTHFNTSWDKAKFEVCGHKYADISEGGYGVAIMNNCKYGHDIHDGIIQLSLLRSPTDPNPDADQGIMRVTYSMCMHEGTLAESDVAKQAYYLNYPMTAIRATGNCSKLPVSFSAININAENVICETLKKAENGQDIVARFYESKNCRTTTEISTDLNISKVYICDMMENELEEIPVANGKFALNFGGFEIVTVKFKKG